MKLTKVLATIVLVACFATSAFAQSSGLTFTPYFTGYFNMFYTHSNNSVDGLVDETINDFEYSISSDSYFGAEMTYGRLSSTIELQFDSEFISNAFLTYKMGRTESLSFGIMDTIAYYNNYSQISNDWNALIYYGALNDTSKPMIKWSGWGLNIAIVSGAGLEVSGVDGSVTYFNNIVASNSSDYDILKFHEFVPRFEASYDINTSMFVGNVFASYAPYILEYETLQGEDGDTLVNTFSVGTGGQFIFGNLTVDAGLYFGSNLYLSDSLNEVAAPVMSVKYNTSGVATGFDVNDTMSVGGAISVAYSFNDMLIPSIGAGYASSFVNDATYESMAVYANVFIQVYEWLLLAPEVAFTKDVAVNIATPTAASDKLYIGFITQFTF